MDLRRAAACASALLGFATAPALARTLMVDDDGADCRSADYTAIQQAVDAAQPGDKILVCAGLYPEHVVVQTDLLQIEARGAPGEVLLQGQGEVGELGIVLRDTVGVVVQGFTVQGYGRAQIRIETGSGNTVRKNVTRNAAVNDGIQVISGSNNVVELNTSHGNVQDGIFVGQIAGVPGAPPSGNVIRYNDTFNNRTGINLLQSGSGNVVFGNHAHDNRQTGILNATLSNGTEIKFNHVVANGLTPIPGAMGVGVGILVALSNLVTVSHNRTEGNGTNGIALNRAADNVVTHNLSGANLAAGVALNAAAGSVVEQNLLYRNLDGIRLFSTTAPNLAAANLLRSNLIRRSGRDGIRAEATLSGNTIEGNVAFDSVEHDAHDDTNGTGTAGTANLWIDNHCGTENRPGLCDH